MRSFLQFAAPRGRRFRSWSGPLRRPLRHQVKRVLKLLKLRYRYGLLPSPFFSSGFILYSIAAIIPDLICPYGPESGCCFFHNCRYYTVLKFTPVINIFKLQETFNQFSCGTPGKRRRKQLNHPFWRFLPSLSLLYGNNRQSTYLNKFFFSYDLQFIQYASAFIC